MRCGNCGTANATGMRYCGMCGRALTASHGERERRRVSVVFVDLMGFSTLTRGLDPEELRDLADEVLTVVAGVVEDYDGYVDAFRGDGLIAVFGAPHSHPDDACRAVSVAAASLRAIEEIGRARGLDLQGRAGVGTGMVIAGSIGSGRIREYTVMGSTVNLTSRLESAAEPGQVWVCEETFQASRHRLAFERVDGVSLRGFPTVTSAFRYLTDRDRDPDPYARLPFVGRRRELTRLDTLLESVRAEGTARLMWLVGEAGSGKTRLLREFERRLDGRSAAAIWVTSNATQSFSWTALAEALFDLHPADDDRRRYARVQQALEEILPGETRWHRLILGSLDLVPGSRWNRLERRSVDRTMLAWRDLVKAMASHRAGREAMVVIVECERAETALEQFVALLAKADAPLLVLRPTRGRDLAGDAERLVLEPLTTAESLELLDGVTDPAFRVAAHALVEQVGGVPAAIFELAHALAATPDSHVSVSLLSLLQARLDALDPSARRLLAVAALVGDRCWEGLLRATMADAADHLATLRRADVLVQETTSTMPGEVEYRFRSELLRRAVLQMTPYSERPMLHLRIATWLEQHAPLAFSELAGEHFERGGAPDAAYAHFLAAADDAELEEDTTAADRLYGRLLALDVDGDLTAEAALAYAQAALRRGDPSLTRRQLEVAAAAIEALPVERRTSLGEAHGRLAADVAALAVEAGESTAIPRR
jgi:class 3 adenylate cyclase